MIYRKQFISLCIIVSIYFFNIFQSGLILNFNKNNFLIDSYLISIILSGFLFFLLIFSIVDSYNTSFEFEVLICLALFGLIILIASSNFIMLYLGLELYSFSVYALLISPNSLSPRTKILAIVYLIINSISTAILLVSILFFYFSSGSIDTSFLFLFSSFDPIPILNISLGFNLSNLDSFFKSLFLLVLLFKLGSGPFFFLTVRLLTLVEPILFLFFIILSKYFLFFFLFKWSFLSSSNLLYLLGVFSLFLGSLGGLFFREWKPILTYSSILNLGLILIVLSYTSNFWSLFHFLVIYFFNLLLLFSLLFLPSSFSFLSLILAILSFIGIPPLGGFYAKVGLLPYFLSNYFNIFMFVFSSVLSSLYYLKFLYLPFSLNVSPSLNNKSLSLIASFSLLFLVFYPFFSSFLFPFFSL